MSFREAVTWLFVPGSRPDRFERAASAGAHEVILDLEDAVAPGSKDSARAGVAAWLDGPGTGWVRVNGLHTDAHEADVAVVVGRPGLRGLVVPKAEDASALADLRHRLPDGVGLVGLVESALGVYRARELATNGAVDRLALGSVDLALDLGAEETDEALLMARSTLVLASRLGRLPAPIDGVTLATDDDEAARAAAERARGLGFGGKLCIHPRQLGPVAAGFRPTTAQLAWATVILEAADARTVGGVTPDVFTVDGAMVDLPVLARARAVLARTDLTTGRS